MREGGSRAWRNNNPGNIRKGSFTEMAGAIGDDGSFAIFPDLKTGFEAMVNLLKSPSYNVLTLEKGIHRYAPPSENNSGRYVSFVEVEANVPRGEVLGTLPAKTLRAIATAIQKMEGWQEGSERPNLPSSLVMSGSGAALGSVTAADAAAHEWMQIAEDQAALPTKERSTWADPGENPRILNYFRIAAPWFDPPDGDETDWCAAFVNFCVSVAALAHCGAG